MEETPKEPKRVKVLKFEDKRKPISTNLPKTESSPGFEEEKEKFITDARKSLDLLYNRINNLNTKTKSLVDDISQAKMKVLLKKTNIEINHKIIELGKTLDLISLIKSADLFRIWKTFFAEDIKRVEKIIIGAEQYKNSF